MAHFNAADNFYNTDFQYFSSLYIASIISDEVKIHSYKDSDDFILKEIAKIFDAAKRENSTITNGFFIVFKTYGKG